MVDAGIEARIRLDAAERDLEDTKDKVILEGAVHPRPFKCARFIGQRIIGQCVFG